MTSYLPSVALLLLVAAVYWQALTAGFVWDDKVFILESVQIQQWAGLWDIWRNPAASNELHYWPLLSTSFWLDHKLWGFNPAGFHLSNLLLHSINCLLLWRILLLLGLPGAWFIAALFAVHPLHVEPVMWITARKDLLSTVFYLLAFMGWLRFRGLQDEHLQQRKQRRRLRRSKARQIQAAYLQLLLCYIAALLSKTVAITLPAVLLLWAWWQQGRITRQDVLQAAPLFFIALFIGLYGVDYYSGRAHIEFEYAFAERVIIAGKALWFYAAKLLWPQPLLVIYPHWDIDPARWLNWLAPVAALALAVVLYAARRRLGRGPLAGALFFAITLSPMLGFADNSYMRFSFAADRYQYLASVGLMMVLVTVALAACRRSLPAASAVTTAVATAITTVVTTTAAVLVLILCAFLSMRHAALFQDEVALFRHVVATNPDAPRAYPSLGGALMDESPAEAVEVFRIALQREPDDTHTYTRLSGTLIELARYQEAEELLNQAMAMGLDEYPGVNTPLRRSHLGAKIPYNLGILMLQQERLEEAEAAFRRVLELEADNQDAMGRLAVLYFNAERFAEALPLFRRIADFQPDRAQSHLNLGATLAQVGELQEALQSLERAVAIEPQNESARQYRDAVVQGIEQQLSNEP